MRIMSLMALSSVVLSSHVSVIGGLRIRFRLGEQHVKIGFCDTFCWWV
jgi:hypothetical protein